MNSHNSIITYTIYNLYSIFSIVYSLWRMKLEVLYTSLLLSVNSNYTWLCGISILCYTKTTTSSKPSLI